MSKFKIGGILLCNSGNIIQLCEPANNVNYTYYFIKKIDSYKFYVDGPHIVSISHLNSHTRKLTKLDKALQ